MKRILFLCALVVGLFAGPSAHADTYSLSFAGCFGLPIGGYCFGTPVTNGTTTGGQTNILLTTNGAPGFLTAVDITGIQGTVDIGGDIYTIGSLSNGLGGDNLLWGGLFGPTVDAAGVDFLLSGTGSPDTYTELDLTWDTVTGDYTYSTEHCTFQDHKKTCTPETASGTSWGLAISDIDPAPAATPEPGSLALLGTSILGGAGLLRRRFLA